MLHLPVFLEDLQALLTIHFQHVSPKLVPSAEQFVELPIPEADYFIFCTFLHFLFWTKQTHLLFPSQS